MDAALPDFDPAAQQELLSAARERIESHRKQPVTLCFQDRNGTVLPGEEFQVELLNHHFQFGENLWALDTRYRNQVQHQQWTRSWQNLFTDVFNSANNLCYWTERPANDASKTEEHQGEQRVENFAQTVDWTLANGMTAKGHPLFWSIPKCIPDWVKRYDLDTFWTFAEVRVRNLVARFKGRVTVWDAVNEALWEAAPEHLDIRDWPHIETAGVMADYIEKVLTWCREEDPDGTFLINDYGLVAPENPKTNSKGESVTASRQRERYLELLAELQKRGSAPDAVGLQAHTGWVPLELFDRCLNQMGSAGIPVHITEFWARERELTKMGVDAIRAKELTAEYNRQVLTMAFANPHVEAFYFWGFMGAAVDMGPDGGYSLNPLYEAIRSCIHDDWGIRTTATSDATGEWTQRLFPGTYAVRRRQANGQWKGTRIDLQPNNPSLVCTF